MGVPYGNEEMNKVALDDMNNLNGHNDDDGIVPDMTADLPSEDTNFGRLIKLSSSAPAQARLLVSVC